MYFVEDVTVNNIEVDIKDAAHKDHSMFCNESKLLIAIYGIVLGIQLWGPQGV